MLLVESIRARALRQRRAMILRYENGLREEYMRDASIKP